MLVILLLFAVFLLAFLNYYQYSSQKRQNENIVYIQEKLSQIINDESREKLLVHTDEISLKKLLIEMNRLLEQKQKMIDDFNKMEISMRKMLSNISHDLKTPLTVVLGYLEILMNESMTSKAETETLLIKVHSKAIDVLDLMNKFFDLAKLESGDKDIPLTRVNMNDICSHTILGFYDVLSSKGFEVVIDLPDRILYALGNTEAIDRILNNLISNALQYGSDGNVVGITLRNDDQFIYVDVWDKGKGIQERHKDSVFERMYTLEDSRNKANQGSGLGLTITKRLVEKMGGQISLKSKTFEKTIFTIRLNQITF